MRAAGPPSRWLGLAIAILVCEGVGILSALLSNTRDNPWFDQLIKPSWNPPDAVFGPVWTILYLLMGISAWAVWYDTYVGISKRPAKVVFVLQLIANFFWSILFFRFQSPLAALIDILILLFLIVSTMILFQKHSKIATNLLIPYLLWVLFATALNFEIWRLNYW
jgi:tryptophan-rich sensory protein